MNLLLLSNSTNYGQEYMEFSAPIINQFLKNQNAKNVLFIPFAAANFSYDAYLEKVQKALNNNQINLTSIHSIKNTEEEISTFDTIMIGGGNTFHLLQKLCELNLIDVLKKHVQSGAAYIGWSAGANTAGKSIKTTNDMPIVYPPTFNALSFIPYHINPHYTTKTIEGHNGETRDQRLQEFIAVNPTETVLAMPEGFGIEVNNNIVRFVGNGKPKIISQKGIFEVDNLKIA